MNFKEWFHENSVGDMFKYDAPNKRIKFGDVKYDPTEKYYADLNKSQTFRQRE